MRRLKLALSLFLLAILNPKDISVFLLGFREYQRRVKP